MAKFVEGVRLSEAATEGLGEFGCIYISIYAVPGGFIFTYAGCHQNHDWYGAAGGKEPFATIESAVAAAEDVGDEDNQPTGPGADVGEFCGDPGEE